MNEEQIYLNTMHSVLLIAHKLSALSKEGLTQSEGFRMLAKAAEHLVRSAKEMVNVGSDNPEEDI
jgi:hypothetical protein